MIYKYSKAKWAISALNNKRMLLSDPRLYNDPFEFLPATRRGALTEENIQKYLHKDHMQGHLARKSPDEQEDFANCLRNPAMHPKMFIDITASKLVTSCFSYNKKNILMWSHYGDCHKGIAIGFDEKLVASFGSLCKVLYKHDRPAFDPTMEKVPGTWIYDFIANKAPCWKYEKELRFVALREECKAIREKLFLPFPKEAVKEILIGCRCSKIDFYRLGKVFLKRYPDVKIKRMNLHRHKFKFEIKGVSKKLLKKIAEPTKDEWHQPQFSPLPSRPS